MEIWKKLTDYNYEASNFGRIKGLASGKILRPCKTKHGQYIVALCRNRKPKNFTVGRVVALAFLPNPLHQPYVYHNDHDKTNNRVENLRWGTYDDEVMQQQYEQHVELLKNQKTFNSITDFGNE